MQEDSAALMKQDNSKFIQPFPTHSQPNCRYIMKCVLIRRGATTIICVNDRRSIVIVILE
uniref:Uncharacterized protein n=1 Tax=Arundo donax TaxID=35708 RepID=A0A0A9DFB0_ARUDO